MLQIPVIRTLARLAAPCRSNDVIRGLATAAAGSGDAEREKMINKLLYRSRQRGFLELDLLVGLWAEREVPKMDTAMLQHFATVLDQENPDLFKWLTGQQDAPNVLQANPAFKALKNHVAQQLSDSCHQDSQAAPGKEWLRGWDDSWRSSAKAGHGGESGAPRDQQQQQQHTPASNS